MVDNYTSEYIITHSNCLKNPYDPWKRKNLVRVYLMDKNFPTSGKILGKIITQQKFLEEAKVYIMPGKYEEKLFFGVEEEKLEEIKQQLNKDLEKLNSIYNSTIFNLYKGDYDPLYLKSYRYGYVPDTTLIDFAKREFSLTLSSQEELFYYELDEWYCQRFQKPLTLLYSKHIGRKIIEIKELCFDFLEV